MSRDDYCRQVVLRILGLCLPIARVMRKIAVETAVREAVSAGHFGIVTRMHVMVALHLGRRAMRTIMVALGLIGHCAGRQREIQPDGGKQPEGAAAPDSALALYAARMSQVFVSTRFSALLPNPCMEAIGRYPRASRTAITMMALKGAFGAMRRAVWVPDAPIIVEPYGGTQT